MKMNKKFYRKVSDYMPVQLPKPQLKPRFIFDEADGLIPIITVTCEGVEW